jgi:hypothetical protein
MADLTLRKDPDELDLDIAPGSPGDMRPGEEVPRSDPASRVLVFHNARRRSIFADMGIALLVLGVALLAFVVWIAMSYI